jgi:hypothetical protein
MIFKIKFKEKSNHIDDKQQFSAISEYANTYKYLYEFDVKTRHSFSSPEHTHFLKTFQVFQDSTSLKRKLGYKIHYTSIPSYSVAADLRGWFVFKLTVGLNKKVSLNLVLDSIKTNLNDKSTEVIKSRIVKNPNQLDAVTYFEELTDFLRENHPDCNVVILNQIFNGN